MALSGCFAVASSTATVSFLGIPPALPVSLGPDAPAAGSGSTSRSPAGPPSHAEPPLRSVPAPRPSRPRPSGSSTSPGPAAAPPSEPASCRATPASGSSGWFRCAAAGPQARPAPGRYSVPTASRSTEPRTRWSRIPQPWCGPWPTTRSPGDAEPIWRPVPHAIVLPDPQGSGVPPHAPCSSPTNHGALTYRPHLRVQRLPNASSGSRIMGELRPADGAEEALDHLLHGARQRHVPAVLALVGIAWGDVGR